jgi:hypothetical protein
MLSDRHSPCRQPPSALRAFQRRSSEVFGEGSGLGLTGFGVNSRSDLAIPHCRPARIRLPGAGHVL